MKRVGHLTERISDLDNIYLACIKACKGKHCKADAIDFMSAFDDNIEDIKSSIASGVLRVGKYHYFTIYDPKQRTICAAPFRDRIIHHAIMNVCHEYFDSSLIDTTYATRIGKGIYGAIDKAVQALSRYKYVVKLDFRKYYDNVDHDVLKTMLRRKFKDSRLLMMLDEIIDSYSVTEGKGLPIGNLTSQYFANYYLSDLDHRAKEYCRVPVYIRYMDDILMCADSREELISIVKVLDSYSHNELHLSFKPPIYRRAHYGISFLGYKVMPYRYTLNGRSKRRFRSKFLKYDKCLMSGEWSDSVYEEHILPLLAFASHGNTCKFRRSCIDIATR